MRKLICFLLLGSATALVAQTCNGTGNVLTAGSCNQADVQQCANIMTATTTQINIPANTCHWTTPVTFNIPTGSTNLLIAGAGNITSTTTGAGGGDATVIVDDYSTNNSVFVINTNSTASSVVRLAGITVKAGLGPAAAAGIGLIGVTGSEQFRFDHSHLDTTAVQQISGIRLDGCIYGVADHDLVDAIGVNNGIQPYNQDSCFQDGLGVGDQAFTQAAAYGTANAFYIEYSTFNNGFATDCYKGGAFVVRDNIFNEGINGNTNGNEVVQTHPTGGAARWRGCRFFEAYDNVFNINNFMNGCFWISSGSGFVFRNSALSGTGSNQIGCRQFIIIESVLSTNGAYGQQAVPNGWGYCGGVPLGSGTVNTSGANVTWVSGNQFSTAWPSGSMIIINGNSYVISVVNSTTSITLQSSGLTQSGVSYTVGSNWNGNTTAYGYPCLDQPGRGKGDLLVGGFTQDGSGTNNVCNATTNPGCNTSNPVWPHQAVEPWYEWSTLWGPVPQNTSHIISVNIGPQVLQANREFYNGTADQGGPITFNATTGVGVGTFATMQTFTTCTNGVGYWATDKGNWNQSGSGGQGQFYVCSNNTWVLYYVPYTFPHPLEGGAPPPPPSGNPSAINMILVPGDK